MSSPHRPKLTADLLGAYADAALLNAEALLSEASLLRDHLHMARAYFLAVACIEETGKGLLAYHSRGRNLADPAVCTALVTRMENHPAKISYALFAWASGQPDKGASFKTAMDLVLHLKRGREPSMYADLRIDPDRAQMPSEVVRPIAAVDCIKLAGHCLAHARDDTASGVSMQFSQAHDKLLTMKPVKFSALLNTEDFWHYFLSRMQAGDADIAEAVIGYERDHLRPGTTFGSSP